MRSSRQSPVASRQELRPPAPGKAVEHLPDLSGPPNCIFGTPQVPCLCAHEPMLDLAKGPTSNEEKAAPIGVATTAVSLAPGPSARVDFVRELRRAPVRVELLEPTVHITRKSAAPRVSPLATGDWRLATQTEENA